MDWVERFKRWYFDLPVFEPLRKSPAPLFSQDQKLVLFMSAKAGFTFSTKWFFNHIGLLEDALAYNSWVHRYRIDIYMKGQDYLSGRRQFCKDPGIYTVVKITREPYSRAVSSYIHANTNMVDNKILGTFLKRDLADRPGEHFSFREYISWLETLDLTACNPHHRVQTHAAERAGIIKPQHLIDLADVQNGLKRVENQLGLQPVDASVFRSSLHHTVRNTGHDGSFCGDSRFDFRYDKNGDRLSAPPGDAFYDRDLRRRVAALYAEDFARYHYPVNID